LSAAIDHLMAAVHRYPFSNAKDRRICEMLSCGVSWWRTAAKVHCSKRRVQEVSKCVAKWKDPESDAHG
jgi:hypothetical protein